MRQVPEAAALRDRSAALPLLPGRGIAMRPTPGPRGARDRSDVRAAGPRRRGRPRAAHGSAAGWPFLGRGQVPASAGRVRRPSPPAKAGPRTVCPAPSAPHRAGAAGRRSGRAQRACAGLADPGRLRPSGTGCPNRWRRARAASGSAGIVMIRRAGPSGQLAPARARRPACGILRRTGRRGAARAGRKIRSGRGTAPGEERRRVRRRGGRPVTASACGDAGGEWPSPPRSGQRRWPVSAGGRSVPVFRGGRRCWWSQGESNP